LVPHAGQKTLGEDDKRNTKRCPRPIHHVLGLLAQNGEPGSRRREGMPDNLRIRLPFARHFLVEAKRLQGTRAPRKPRADARNCRAGKGSQGMQFRGRRGFCYTFGSEKTYHVIKNLKPHIV